MHGSLQAGERLICAACLDTLTAALAVDLVTLDPADVAAAEQLDEPELTSEEEYEAALRQDRDWELDAHGELHPRRGSRRRGWGTP